jgi:hypothetical protein
VVDRSEGYLHSDLMAEILEHVIVKFLGIVDGDFSWDAIATVDVFPKKILDGYRAYICDGLHLNPFYEILNCYNSEGVVALN